MTKVFSDDFSSFPLGPFPYDLEHSAMGEYHYFPETGYKGNWYDPIADWSYRGPSWMITNAYMDGTHVMEQMRIKEPKEKKAVPVLRAGEIDWKDYQARVLVQPMTRRSYCGLLFRYQTSMMYYALLLVENRAELHKVDKTKRTVLASAECQWSTEEPNELSVRTEGNHFDCYVNGTKVFSAEDDRWQEGCIALSACMPCRFKDVEVEMSEAAIKALEDKRKAHEEKVLAKRAKSAQLKLLKKIDLGSFGAARQLRFGHLTGTDEMFFIICQNQRRVYKDRYPVISCMTAVSLETGKILWQKGEAREDEDILWLTTDLPFQIYDIDGDGIDEVIASWDFKLMILDGRDGSIKKCVPTPRLTAPEESVTGLEFGTYAFERLNVDAIRIVNVSGNERPEEIMIKDRYSRFWIFDKDLHFKWEFSKYNTGHFPYDYDFDKDGKNEIYSCYNMVDHDGKLLWSLPIETDHTDEIIVGRFDPDNPEEQIAIVSGWEGFMILNTDGTIALRDINGHGQRISAGNYDPKRKGFEICTTTYWENNAIIYMHDCKGKELWHREMKCNGNIITPVNWNGNGEELVLLNGDPVNGGLIDGEGDVVVPFPDDGHPVLAAEVIDLYGDGRDEIVLWDQHSLWIYTQDREAEKDERGIYKPHKYPHYNSSNYRGEYCFPHWEKE